MAAETEMGVVAAAAAAGRAAGGRSGRPVKDWGTGLTAFQLGLAGVSHQQYVDRHNERQQARQQLCAALEDSRTSPSDKHHLRCQYTLQYGKTLFACPRCWLLPTLCICNKVTRLQTATKVVVQVHHDEWGKGSNTGSVLGCSLVGSQLLMKGLKEHDAELQRLLDDQDTTTAVLFPGDNAMTPEELQQVASERTNGRIAIVALDGTWNHAQKMRLSLPANTPLVKLSATAALQHSDQSLFRPLRKYSGDVAATGRVSTLEAVAALLRDLEGPEEGQRVFEGLLDSLRLKVDAMCVQKNKPPPYNTVQRDMFPELKTRRAAAASRLQEQQQQQEQQEHDNQQQQDQQHDQQQEHIHQQQQEHNQHQQHQHQHQQQEQGLS